MKFRRNTVEIYISDLYACHTVILCAVRQDLRPLQHLLCDVPTARQSDTRDIRHVSHWKMMPMPVASATTRFTSSWTEKRGRGLAATILLSRLLNKLLCPNRDGTSRLIVLSTMSQDGRTAGREGRRLTLRASLEYSDRRDGAVQHNTLALVHQI